MSEPYTVRFKRSGTKFFAHCTCPAGEVGQICKHRIRILEGSAEGIVSGNGVEVKMAESWLIGSNVESVLSDVRAAEKRLEATKKELSALKKMLARIISE